MKYYAVIPAAGTGSRFGAETPKQYLPLAGKPVMLHSLERLRAALPLAMIYVVVAHDDRMFDAEIGEQPGVTVLRCGGGTRAASVRNGLDAIAQAQSDDWVLVHDAVRPCVDRASLIRLQTELAGDDVGGLLAIPISSTLKRADVVAANGAPRSVRTEARDGLWNAQTPQMFRYALLRKALSRPGAEQATDEAHAVEELGARPRLVQGSGTNIKITFPDDLKLAEAILAAERNG